MAVGHQVRGSRTRRPAWLEPLEMAPADPIRWGPWIVAFLVLVGIAFATWAATRMIPSYDPMGWLVWGWQIWHARVNLNAAPSWKPLGAMFTIPYALFGRITAMNLWTITSLVGTLMAFLFSGRIARHVTLQAQCPAWAGWLSFVAAGLGVFGLVTWVHLTMIANSDQLNVALLLAAIDAYLCRRPRLAFVMLSWASLGRPECWVFMLLYGAFCWVRVPRMRLMMVVLGVAVLAAWLVLPYFDSHSAFSAGDQALNQKTACTNSKLICVPERFRTLWEWPMQLLWVLSLVIALWRRDRTMLGLIGVAVVWVIVELGFALHGWSGVQRYLTEAGAVMCTVAGSTLAQLAAGLPDLRGRGRFKVVVRWGSTVVALALIAVCAPIARHRLSTWKWYFRGTANTTRAMARMRQAITEGGGPKRLLSCGYPVTAIGSQSTLAYWLNVNVSAIGFNVAHQRTRTGVPIVLFTQHNNGWSIQTLHEPASATSCSAIHIATPTN